MQKSKVRICVIYSFKCSLDLATNMTFKINGTEFDVTSFVDDHSVDAQGDVIIEYEVVDNSTSRVKVCRTLHSLSS